MSPGVALFIMRTNVVHQGVLTKCQSRKGSRCAPRMRSAPRGLIQVSLIKSHIKTNHTFSTQAFSLNLSWRWVAPLWNSHERSGMLPTSSSSHSKLLWLCLSAEPAVVAPSQSEITGRGQTQTVFRGETSKTARSMYLKRRKLVKHPFKWNMELWFALKVAEAWVTFVNTHLPPWCFITEIAPRQSSAASSSEKHKIEERCYNDYLIRCWVTHCWVVVFRR